jgi:hypothetical protein
MARPAVKDVSSTGVGATRFKDYLIANFGVEDLAKVEQGAELIAGYFEGEKHVQVGDEPSDSDFSVYVFKLVDQKGELTGEVLNTSQWAKLRYELDSKGVEKGDYVQIDYLGKTKLKNGRTPHQFKVLVEDSET